MDYVVENHHFDVDEEKEEKMQNVDLIKAEEKTKIKKKKNKVSSLIYRINNKI